MGEENCNSFEVDTGSSLIPRSVNSDTGFYLKDMTGTT